VEGDAGFAGGVGLGGADPEVDGALWDQAVTLRSDDGEFANAKNERSNLRCSRVEMHTLKSDERMDWSAVDIWMRDVELDDFITSNSRDVFYSDRNMNWRRTGDLRIDRNRWSRNRLTAWRKVAGSEVGSKEFRIREGGVGEAVAEGEEGRFGGVAVGAVGHGVAGEGRELRGVISLRDILLHDLNEKDDEVRMMRAYLHSVPGE